MTGHIAGLLISGLLMLAPPAGGDGAADDIGRMLNQAAKMTPAEQTQWMRGLEQRSIEAARAALPPDDAAKHEARLKKLLYQQKVSWRTLREVIEETEQLEAAARTAAVRQIAPPQPVATGPSGPLKKGTGSEPTNENHAKNTGREVPVPLFQQAASVEELRNAILPRPREEALPPPEPTVAKVSRVPPRLPEAVSAPATANAEESVRLESAAIDRVRPSNESGDESPHSKTESSQHSKIAASAPATIARHAACPPTVEEPPAIAMTLPEELASPMINDATPIVPLPKVAEELAGPPHRELTPEPMPDKPPTLRVPPLRPRSLGADQPVLSDSSRVLLARAKQVISAVLSEVDAEPMPTVSHAPRAADSRVALSTETQTAPPNGIGEESRASDGEASVDAVQVDVEGLAARIAGHNLSLRGLEAELDEKGPWDAARLAPMLDRLKILATRHNDLNLFREAVPESKRESLAKLQSPRSAVAQLGARIFEVRGNVTGQNFAGTEAQREAELQRLDELSRALAELAGK